MSNFFNAEYYESIIASAVKQKYTFLTMREYMKTRPGSAKRIAILRHDIDAKPLRNKLFHNLEKAYNIVSSNYLLVHDINYNPFAVNVLKLFMEIQKSGSEIGLHSNYVETAAILSTDPLNVLETEIIALRSHFDVYGIACHRNINHMANSLPHLESKWDNIQRRFNLEYQAYDQVFMENLEFVNEGLMPSLGWRNKTPEEVIDAGVSFCLSTHPHWWHMDYAYED